jgi:hypothetical protein
MKLTAREFLRRFFLHVLPRASSESATTACSPTASETRTSLWPDYCSPTPNSRSSRLRPNTIHNRQPCGTAHVAAVRCALHADSLPSRSTPHDNSRHLCPSTCTRTPAPTCASTPITSSSGLCLPLQISNATLLFPAFNSLASKQPSPTTPSAQLQAYRKRYSIPIVHIADHRVRRNVSGFLLVSLSKTPRTHLRSSLQPRPPRRFRSRLATTRKLFSPCYTARSMRLYVIALFCPQLPAIPTQAQWDLEDSRTTANLRGIVNVGGGVAWASGTNGTVVHRRRGLPLADMHHPKRSRTSRLPQHPSLRRQHRHRHVQRQGRSVAAL